MVETDANEFKRFVDQLLNPDPAPKRFSPWFLPCTQHGKDPAVQWSWKADRERLTLAEAITRLKHGDGNVGLAARHFDPLILVDIDDPAIDEQLKPTLTIRSRSRVGTHAIYFADPDDEVLPTNIPTEQGEVRSSDQYVVAPGSYVPCPEEELDTKVAAGELTEEQKHRVLNDPNRGRYTIANDRPVAPITVDELPAPFVNQYRWAKKARKEAEERRQNHSFDPDTVEGGNHHSALYDLTMQDITATGIGQREAHPLHPSDTEANWVVSGELGHCWRHGVSLNAIQFLCVEAGYASCVEAGTPHRNANQSGQVQAGPSIVLDNNEAIWVAWTHAKKQGYIPEDDRVPVRALYHIAHSHDLCPEEDIPEPGSDDLLPREAYRKALTIAKNNVEPV